MSIIETEREQRLRVALESLVLLVEQVEAVVRPDDELGSLQVWADLEQAASMGRAAIVDDDLLMLRPGRERVQDVARFLVGWDEMKAAGL